MATLKVFYQNQVITEFELAPNELISIGRDDKNQIVLKDLEGISRQHLEVQFVNGYWKVKCVAKNGLLFVDGTKVTEIILRNRMKFAIPHYEFEFLDSTNSQTQSVVEVTDDKTAIALLPAIATLVKYDAYGQVEQIYTLRGTHNIIGSDVVSAVVLNHPKVSPKHFEIQRQGNLFFIRDLESANGTIVNGRPISSDKWVPLHSGDEISIFDLKAFFFYLCHLCT